MTRARLRVCAMALLAAVLSSACGGTGTPRAGPARSRPAAVVRARWAPLVHASRPLDVVGPRRDGSFVLAAHGRLWLLSSSGRVRPYPGSYRSPGGEEAYIALAPPRSCFGTDTVYALRLRRPQGVSAIGTGGRVRRFARLTPPGLLDGITFDLTGRFAHRLLVTVEARTRSTVYAIDCRGRVTVITSRGPKVEGGIAVAPATFGRFGGDLIASDENGGRIFAVSPGGRSFLVAHSGLPHGGDTGVESEAFIPAHGYAGALVADRLTPGNRHPGDDVVLRVSAAALARAGVHPGDLLDVTEGGAHTIAVTCGRARCGVRHVADGPAVAHPEGHVAIEPG